MQLTPPTGGMGNKVGIRITGSAPSENRIEQVKVGASSVDGIQVDGVTQNNTLIYAEAGSNIGHRSDNANNTGCGLRIYNGTKNLKVEGASMIGEKWGVCVENASQIELKDTSATIPMDGGFRIYRSHGISIERGEIMAFGGGAAQRGIHIIESSAYRLSGMFIMGVGGVGLDIEGVPAQAVGASQIGQSRADNTTVVQLPRAEMFDPVVVPPWNEQAGAAIFIDATGSHGIHIHGGAPDVDIVGASITGSTTGHGLFIEGAGKNISITESRIGATSRGPAGNAGDGVRIENHANRTVIGAAHRGNTVSGNQGFGIQVIASKMARIQGNFIGTHPAGLEAMGNKLGGVKVKTSEWVYVGGLGLFDGNVISGNIKDGVEILGNSPGLPHLVASNFIGTDKDGKKALGNKGSGVALLGPADPNSAATKVKFNLIGGNDLSGIFVNGLGSAPNTQPPVPAPSIMGNLVGKFDWGQATIGAENKGRGIRLKSVKSAWVRGNLVRWNRLAGIKLESSAYNRISKNYISFHTATGIRLVDGSHGNQILLNDIWSNFGNGITVTGFTSGGNNLSRNSIWDNFGKGIGLVNGGNWMMPSPTIRSIGASKNLRSFYGDVPREVPDGSRIELFMDSGSQARHYLATGMTVNKTFSFFKIAAPEGTTFDGKQFRATVMDATSNDTSELGDYVAGERRCYLPEKAGAPPPAGFDFIGATVRRGVVYFFNVGSGVERALPGGNQDGGMPPSRRDAAVCHDASGNEHVVFAEDTGGGKHDLVLTSSAGESSQVLASDPADDLEPVFSADCARITFTSTRDGNAEIYLMNRDGTGLTRLTSNPADDRHPDFSPDGTKIVFASDRSVTATEIYTMDASSGENVEQKTTLGGVNRRPAWRKEADTIAFEHCTGAAPGYEPCGINLLAVGTGSVTELPLDSDPSDCHFERPEWFVSGDGDSYLVVTVKSPGTSEQPHLYLMNMNGSLIWQISPDGQSDAGFSCCLSP